jgi:hypothetical protein
LQPLLYSLTFIKLYLASRFIYQTFDAKSTLEKTERAIQNGKSIETGNTGYTRHRTKTSKTKNTTQKTKKMNNTDPIRKSIIFLSVLCDKNRVSIKQELQDKHVTKKKEKKKKDK